MFKTSLLATATVAALLSTSATATTMMIGGVQFPIKPDPLTFGEQNREQICRQYNQQVKVIKNSFEEEGLDSTIGFLGSLCTHLSLSDGQLEDSGVTFNYPVYDDYNLWLYQFTEKVDVSRKIELLVLSQSGETRYLYFVDGDAVLREQSNSGGWVPHEAPPNFLKEQEIKLTAQYNAHGVGNTLGVFNRVNSKVIVTNHFPTGTNDPKIDIPNSKKNRECLQNYRDNGFCVPGGTSNSRYWELESYIPETSNTNTKLAISDTTSFGFDIGANANAEDGLGLSIGFSVETSSTVSTDKSVLVNSTIPLSNDLGISATYNLDPVAVAALYGFGYDSDTAGVAMSDSRLGSSAWRNLDLPLVTRFKETVNERNCIPDDTREMLFDYRLKLERGAYDLDGYGSRAAWDYSQSYASKNTLRSTFIVSTECKIDKNGNYYRTHKPGIFSQP
ncbi:hypothetical protein CJF42_25380 [Pseudoalteromonas sp. NBT06-2]|uniref:hypothetical protein n=1 Tax=Pseudoalteromonas sp. NBT06-2 TaxID=2025950 RepID=UPI000BA505C6|nr:hypothetical protein [Pseudoalteromonas sp. NBT06-2]PAJ71688.1 hypothetical protein CJF42_25380 [Pseudoalteromonas sp. NBT06-2]